VGLAACRKHILGERGAGVKSVLIQSRRCRFRHRREPVKRHRGEPGHTHRHTDTQTNLTTIPTHHRTRATARRPNQRPTQRPQPRSRPLPAADSEAVPCEPDPAAPRSTGGSRTHSHARPHPNPGTHTSPQTTAHLSHPIKRRTHRYNAAHTDETTSGTGGVQTVGVYCRHSQSAFTVGIGVFPDASRLARLPHSTRNHRG